MQYFIQVIFCNINAFSIIQIRYLKYFCQKKNYDHTFMTIPLCIWNKLQVVIIKTNKYTNLNYKINNKYSIK